MEKKPRKQWQSTLLSSCGLTIVEKIRKPVSETLWILLVYTNLIISFETFDKFNLWHLITFTQFILGENVFWKKTLKIQFPGRWHWNLNAYWPKGSSDWTLIYPMVVIYRCLVCDAELQKMPRSLLLPPSPPVLCSFILSQRVVEVKDTRERAVTPLFSFLGLHILDSFLRLLSLRLSPYHQRCKQRRQDGDMRREKSRGNRHLTKWEIMLRSHHFKRWRAECLIVLNSWYNLWI